MTDTTLTRDLATKRPATAPPVSFDAGAVPEPAIVRLPNPWTVHLVTGCSVAGVTTVGAFVAAVLGEVRLDLSAYAVLAAWFGVLLLSYLQGRYDRVRTLVARSVDSA